MIWLSWFLAFVAACSATDDHLSVFLRLAGENGPRVDTLRDGLFRRVRCGPQQGLTETLCRECLSAERIANMTVGHSSPVQHLSSTSYAFLNYFLSFHTCTAESVRHGYVGNCKTYEGCRSQLLFGYLVPIVANTTSPQERVEALERLLRKVKPVFEPDPTKSCFSAEMVISELNSRFDTIASLSSEDATVLLLTSHLYAGECIDVGESVMDFLDDIFLHYGDGCERVMTQSGFTKLWNDLQLQRNGQHIDHGVQKNACGSRLSQSSTNQIVVAATNSIVKHVTDTSSTEDEGSSTPPSKPPKANHHLGHHSSASDVENSSTLVVLMPHSHAAEEDSALRSRVPAHSDHYVVGEESNETASEMGTTATTNSRRIRHTAFSEDHEHKNLANECLPSDDLLQRFLSPGNRLITSSEFLQLCPALVQQAVSGVCSARLETIISTNEKGYRSNDTVFQQVVSQGANPWYAVASVSLITAISLLGLFLLPVLRKSFFVHINAFFMGLAFGTMSGDVVMHLMPQYLGLHQHSEHSEHEHASESTLDRLFPSHLQRQLAFLLTMYLLLLVESIFTAFTDKGGAGKESHHGHSHGPIEINLKDLSVAENVESGEPRTPKTNVSRCTRILEFLKPSNLFTGMTSKAAVIVLADTVHNFADGMAIAVGFSTSYKDGFSTSIAVFFHELPHEIGDFAVLMNCGLSYWKAFVFNLLSGLSAFLGLGVGVFAASLFREWLLCITAGLFFFVVMAEMLPDMRLESKDKWPEFVVKVVGTLFGILLMICIAMYELSTT